MVFNASNCIEKLKSILEDGSLGRPLGARGFVTWYRTMEYYEKDIWRGKWTTEGGGVLINQAIHTLDYFSYLLGKVKTVKAHMSNDSLENVIEVEDTVSARLQMESGVIGVFYATNGYMDDFPPMFEILFENGKARYIDGKLWINGEIVEEDRGKAVGKSYWGNGHEKLLRQYYDERKYFGVVDVEDTMEAVFAMYDGCFTKRV